MPAEEEELSDTPGYRPLISTIAGLAKSRTKDVYDNVTGSFSDETNPTLDEVDKLIDEALLEVSLVIGPDVPDYRPEDPDADHDFLRNAAKAVVTLLTVANIEVSVAPEQANDDRSAYSLLMARYRAALAALKDAISGAIGINNPGPSIVSPVASDGPLGNFPAVFWPDAVEVNDAPWDPRF